MEIRIFSRPAIESLDPPEVPHVIISINCPGEDPAQIQTSPLTVGRVNLFFWDADCFPEGMTQKTYPLICTEDAREIVDLVRAHPNAEQILIHCSAGRSRSAGVAAALHRVLNGNDVVVFQDKRYDPNRRVYREVVQEWERQVGVTNEDGTTSRVVKNDGSGWAVCLLRALQFSKSGDIVIVYDEETVTFAERIMTLKGIVGVRVVVDKKRYERA